MAFAVAAEMDADMIAVCEPNREIAKKRGWIVHKAGVVAMYTRRKNMEVTETISGEGYVLIKTGEVCGYCSPNVPIEDLGLLLDRIEDEMQRRPEGKIILGDLNSKSTIWGERTTDKRGEVLVDWIAKNDLVVLNHESFPTFQRGARTSYIDVTLATARVAAQVTNRAVREKESLSDHRHI